MHIDFNNYTINNKSPLRFQKHQSENRQVSTASEQYSAKPINLNNMPVYYVNFKGKESKKTLLSNELEKAFSTKDNDLKSKYFKKLAQNYSLVLRNCTDEDYIKTVQTLLNNIAFDKYQDKETFENQISLLSAAIQPDSDIAKYVNSELFCKRAGNFLYDDASTVNKINRILKYTKAPLPAIKLEITSHSEYPVNVLSNFADTDFVFDGVEIKSIEGFLQSLKEKDPQQQRKICALDGKRAKGMGKKLNKQRNYDFKNLYWQGKKIDRLSKDYQDLLKAVYNARFKNDSNFRFALYYTKNYDLGHSLGCKDEKRTLLTENEFINILKNLRNDLHDFNY